MKLIKDPLDSTSTRIFLQEVYQAHFKTSQIAETALNIQNSRFFIKRQRI